MEWKDTLENMYYEHEESNPEDRLKEDEKIKDLEVALKHPELESFVKLLDDGSIAIFSGNQQGIKLDPNSETISLFSQNINLIGSRINIRSKENGIRWNGREIISEGDRIRVQEIMSDESYTKELLADMKSLNVLVEE